MTRILLYGHFLTRVFKDVGIDLSKEADFEAFSTYDTYDDQSMKMMKFEKAPNGSCVMRVKRAPAQARGQGQAHLGVEEEVEIREIEDEVDLQSDYQQRELELNIPSLQSEGIQFEATFSEPIMSEPTYTAGPSTQSSFIESSSGPVFTEPPHTEIPPHRAPLTPNHAPLMDLFGQISSLGTHIEKFAIVSDTRFYFMEDRMDQYQVGFTSQFEYLQQRFEHIEDRMDQHQAGFTSQFEHLQQMIEHIEDFLESQHEEMMAYLRSMFPPPSPQPGFLRDLLCSFFYVAKRERYLGSRSLQETQVVFVFWFNKKIKIFGFFY